jgi:hypothetical protein
MVGRKLWNRSPISYRRLHRPRRAEPQNGLRHAGRRPGSRSRRPRRPLVLRAARRRAEAPSRHHSHLHRRAVCGGSDRRPHLDRHIAVDAPPSHDRSTPPKPESAPGTATARPLGLALSHGPHCRPQPLLLDWTNNYGLRPFFPFNPRWYAGSFVFIAEPVIWALLIRLCLCRRSSA